MRPSRTDPSTSLRAERDQAATIARATFDGFLESDLMPSGMQAPAIIWAAAFLVVPSLFLPMQFLAKYPFIRRYFPARLEPTFWNDRMHFLILSTGAIGIVSVILWDTLFPARRDAFVLTPLPVAVPVQMLGRLLGLMSLAFVFVVGLNLLPSFTFPLVASGGFLEMPRAIAGHFVATAAADAFVFFGITSLQGVVILGFGRRAAGKLAAIAQAAAVLVVLLSLIFITPLRALTGAAIERGNVADPALAFNPIAWFLGLYEFIAGSKRAIMAPLALRAIAAAAAATGATLAIYAFGYAKLLKRAVETPSRSTRSILLGAASRVIRWSVVRHPQDQAICAFLIRAIGRSGRHSLLMSIYVGAALAMMVTFVLPDVIRLGPAAFATPSVPLLALPLVLSVGLSVGVRMLMAIPADMSARWIFQTAALTPRRVDAAAHKALLLIVLPPVMALAALIAGGLWDWRLGALHAIYCGALALLLCEVMLARYRGVPLTRPYVAGGSKFHTLWPAYLTAFVIYTFSTASLEAHFLTQLGQRSVLNAAAVFAAMALGFWAWRKFKLSGVEEVTFEGETPADETFKGFNLTEIYAAQAVASKAPRKPS